jgi:hypothetical protein
MGLPNNEVSAVDIAISIRIAGTERGTARQRKAGLPSCEINAVHNAIAIKIARYSYGHHCS